MCITRAPTTLSQLAFRVFQSALLDYKLFDMWTWDQCGLFRASKAMPFLIAIPYLYFEVNSSDQDGSGGAGLWFKRTVRTSSLFAVFWCFFYMRLICHLLPLLCLVPSLLYLTLPVICLFIPGLYIFSLLIWLLLSFLYLLLTIF